MITPSKIELYSKDFYFLSTVLLKEAVVRKLPSGKWVVRSLKGKNLGEYKTKEEAVKRLKQIEYFKNKKKASKDDSYSSIMRDLNKNNKDEVDNFRKKFKENFDKAIIEGIENPEEFALENSKELINKKASAIDLGDPEYAGKYLSDIIKFVMRRISPERRSKSLSNLKKKIYYMNEYDLAAKHVPASSAMGQSITLLKHILLEHNPQYIRRVLNSVVKYL